MENSLSVDSKKTLANGVKIPIIGLGVYKIEDGKEVEDSVKWALEAGYRMFDTASRYNNEDGVGKALRDYGLLREEYFVTTKLWNADQGYESTLKAIDASLEKLGMSYVDLYLVHWPSASEDKNESINKREETWRAMEEILSSGKARTIGVSNYTLSHLEEMKKYATVMPQVNQVEFHPFLFQKPMLDYCKVNNIELEAYSPLAKATKMDNTLLVNLGTKYNKSPAQIMLRWAIEHGTIVIPKSTHQNRIKENIDIFDFNLTPEEINAINNLDEGTHLGWDPSNIA